MKTKKQKFNIKKIKKEMEAQSISNVALANKLKWSRQLLNYHLNNPTISSMWQIAYVLKLDLWDLIK